MDVLSIIKNNLHTWTQNKTKLQNYGDDGDNDDDKDNNNNNNNVWH